MNARYCTQIRLSQLREQTEKNRPEGTDWAGQARATVLLRTRAGTCAFTVAEAAAQWTMKPPGVGGQAVSGDANSRQVRDRIPLGSKFISRLATCTSLHTASVTNKLKKEILGEENKKKTRARVTCASLAQEQIRRC